MNDEPDDSESICHDYKTQQIDDNNYHTHTHGHERDNGRLSEIAEKSERNSEHHHY